MLLEHIFRNFQLAIVVDVAGAECTLALAAASARIPYNG